MIEIRQIEQFCTIQRTIKTHPWDAAAHLETEEGMTAYLNVALEEGDQALIVAVLGDIARAKGITQVARTEGSNRLDKPV